jgi:hydroxypyruvate isomerase
MAVLEPLNILCDHKGYFLSSGYESFDIIREVGSPNVKLLYDIYHMQINEGDVIRTIRNNQQYFGHYHTAGVPGRHEIDESQELFFWAGCCCRATAACVSLPPKSQIYLNFRWNSLQFISL